MDPNSEEWTPQDEPAPELSALHGKIALVLREARQLNEVNSPHRSRSLSNAITRMEEAVHWAEDAYRIAVMEASLKESDEDDGE